MVAQAQHARTQGVVMGRQHAALACDDGFRAMEEENRKIAESPGTTVADGICCIFDQM